MLKNIIENSINRAVDFLYQNQLPWGEFKTLACWNPFMWGSYFDSSPFITSFVLYSLKDLEQKKVKIMTEKAISFLLEEQEKGGLWRFWTSRNKKRVPPDLDDISTISFVLKLNQVSFDNNLQLILNNRNKDNLFLTFIINKEEKYHFSQLIDKFKDYIDCVVNANVLLYLGQNDPWVSSFINQAIRLDQPCSIYYPKKLALFYMVSRAFKNNVTSLGENKELIIKSTLSYQKENGSFGSDLDTALALNTLFNFDYSGKEIDLGINYLLKRQSANGSWKKSFLFLGPFPWRYYGSEELTTALVIEAMKNYGKNL
ncbi:MAG: hypothetical protein QME61_00850 [Patescibacteria group bacterium]|nr:hypothetical protein [Patescibacteria group bacterium]